MKKRCITLCIILTLFTASGCQPVPDEVKENIKQYGDNKYSKEFNFEYCSVDELKEVNMDSITISDANISLPERVDFSGVDSISTGEFVFASDYTSYSDYYKRIFSLPETSSKGFNGALQGDSGIVFEGTKTRDYLYLGDSGELSYISADMQDEGGNINLSLPQERICIDRKELSNQVVHFAGGDVPIQSQVSYVSDYLSNLILDKNLDTHIRTVYTRTNSDGNGVLEMQAVFEYKGVLLGFQGGYMDVDNNSISSVKEMNYLIDIDMLRAEKVDRVGLVGKLDLVQADTVDQVLSFQTAVSIFEKEMATFHQIDVVEVIPLYVLSPSYDAKGGVYYAAPGNKVEFTPVYSFLIKAGEDDSTFGINEGDGLVYVNVNMLNGEVTSNMDKRGFAGSGK